MWGYANGCKNHPYVSIRGLSSAMCCAMFLTSSSCLDTASSSPPHPLPLFFCRLLLLQRVFFAVRRTPPRGPGQCILTSPALCSVLRPRPPQFSAGADASRALSVSMDSSVTWTSRALWNYVDCKRDMARSGLFKYAFGVSDCFLPRQPARRRQIIATPDESDYACHARVIAKSASFSSVC